MAVVCVIPARYGSTRFPGKPLADLAGKPLIQWVYEQASKARTVQDVYVATDDIRIAETVHSFGGKAVMTSETCATGTDRIAEAIAGLEAGIVVNVQGDEPLIEPGIIDAVVAALQDSPECDVSTAAVAIKSIEDFTSPHIVKVVFDVRGHALYFSRSPVPSPARRDIRSGDDIILGYKHVGLYVYRRDALEKISRMTPTELEKTEKLEQLRFLENGLKIKVVVVEHDSAGIDTPEELERLQKKLSR